MIKAFGSILFVIGLAVATNTFAQQAPKIRMIAVADSFVLYVGDDIQKHGRHLVYTTVIVQRRAEPTEDGTPSIVWSVAGWSVNCKSKKLTRYSNRIFDENNDLIGIDTTTKSHPLDALAEIHLQYVCDGKLDHPKLATLESVDGRIAVLSSIEMLKRVAQTGDPSSTADGKAQP